MIANQSPPPASLPSPAPRARRRLIPLVAIALLPLFFLSSGYWLLCQAPTRHHEEEQETPPVNQDTGAAPKWNQWQKPLFAFVVSGQMHGYYDPCGCSDPQYGGLVRRYNFVEALKAKGWEVVGIDLGELAQTQGIQKQNLLKFDLSMKALATMNYRAVGIGKHEILTPLGDALAETWNQKRLFPRPISMTLADAAPGQNYHNLNARPYEIIAINDKLPKIGVLNMVGPDMREQLKGQEKFLSNMAEFPKTLEAFADAKAEIGVILHHEHPEINPNITGIARINAILQKRRDMALNAAVFADTAHKKNPKIPPIHLMMILTDEPEPPALLHALNPKVPTHCIEIGHKGTYVGLVGVYRDPKGGYRFQYEIVKMGPEWETPKQKKAGHPVIALIDEYNRKLKAQDMLGKAPRTLHLSQLVEPGKNGLKATYVGSDQCGKCHDHAWTVWAKTSHAKATDRLENLKNPSGRHFDPECMKCHTTGFQHPGGYNDFVQNPAAWALPANAGKPNVEAHNKALRGVSCESCHGPGSEHVKAPRNKALYPLINPFRVKDEERKLVAMLEQNPKNKQVEAQLRTIFNAKGGMGAACMHCHDLENDVHWGKPGKDLFDKWIIQKHVHHLPERNPLLNPPAKQKEPELKKVNATEVQGAEPRPIIIDIIEKK